MADETAMPDPAELTKALFKDLREKAALPPGSKMVLGFLAGVYIGLGGLFATIALAQSAQLPFGVAQVLAGLVFSLGLALVLIAGAELFTGNTLMAGPVANGSLGAGQAVGALALVYGANFAGALALAGAVVLSGAAESGDGAVRRAAVELGVSKLDKSFGATFVSGILANMLVCLAVWMSHAGKTVTAKVAGLLLPVTAFVAAGFEHSIANMYLLPQAYFLQGEALDQVISVFGVLCNLVPATAGNLLGGAAIALCYGYVYAGTEP
ncbi:formate/nitrite transporter family protein [Falsigemmobacter faecalis]|uniref:Formate/nitrite transporter family protein n=1 Tax=Falsigemmobacter faecalis TaxID=2488730 RepID=A0A3P3DFG6_9RHOB|nr:formate/nitrite transporter family protein [Falsigemmobacter faecalis]RRH73019.1 formate/nitrite transporter family protein [Falsigemmobacter faecalis]